MLEGGYVDGGGGSCSGERDSRIYSVSPLLSRVKRTITTSSVAGGHFVVTFPPPKYIFIYLYIYIYKKHKPREERKNKK